MPAGETPAIRFTAVALLLAALLAAAPAVLLADQAEASLAKYDKPIDDAVDRALAYLAKQQDKEGFWPSGLGKNTGISSLCVMAFLAKGHTPGQGPYGAVINKGLDFVLATQKPNGMLVENASHGPWYCHSIATLMLSEVSGMVDSERQKKIDKALPAAMRLIITAQQVKKPPPFAGGWRYQPTSTDADISCTGWSLMALRSGRNNGTPIPKKAIDDAIGFVLKCRDVRFKDKPAPEPAKGQPKPGVGFCYQPGSTDAGLARTGTAVLCLELCGRHRSKEAVEGGDWILAHPATSFGAEYFYYGLYYSAQGMFQLGGEHWEKFAPTMYDMMLKAQKPDGSWPQAGSNEGAGGPCYGTAMGVLAVSVSYRQLPIYQR